MEGVNRANICSMWGRQKNSDIPRNLPLSDVPWTKMQGYLQSTNPDRILAEAGSSHSPSVGFLLWGFFLTYSRILVSKEKNALPDMNVTRDLLSD